MAHAKVLLPEEFQHARHHVSPHVPLRDDAMLYLSYRSALRAVEIAKLTIADVSDARGNLDREIWIRRSKRNTSRRVTMGSDVQAALLRYLRESGVTKGPLFRTINGAPMTRHAVAMTFHRIYKRAGIVGASSHSGRRTVGTRGARAAGASGQALHGVSRFMGHADARSTEPYMESIETHTDFVVAMFPSQYPVAESENIARAVMPDASIPVGEAPTPKLQS